MISDKAVKCPKCGTSVSKTDVSNSCIQNQEKETGPYDRQEQIAQKERELISAQGNVFQSGNSRQKKRGKVGIVFGIALLLLILILGGYWCYSRSDDQEIHQFVERFAKAVESGDKQTICQLYPKADKTKSLNISYQKDSVEVTRSKGNDTIEVQLNSLQSIRLFRGNKKQMYIASSKGLFAFPKEEMLLAMQTGWINTSLDDVEKAERLKDKQFIPWLEKKAVTVMKSKVKVAKSTVERGENVGNFGSTSADVYNYEVVLENMNNCDIAADAYIVSVVVKGYDFTWWADEGEKKEPYSDSCNSLTGKIIPKKGTVIFSWVSEEYGGAHGGRVPEELNCEVIFEPTKVDAVAAYEPTGKEYLEYLDWKNKQ